MKIFSDLLRELAEFDELMKDIKAKKTPINVLGVSDSVKAHLISSVCKLTNRSGFIVTADEKEARELAEDLRFFADDRVFFFPRYDLQFYDVEARGQDVTRARLSVIKELCSDEPCLIVTTAEAMLQVTVPPNITKENAISLQVGDEAVIDDLAQRLVNLGYCREEMVEGAGQFSIRGGILDVFPCAMEYPVRIEFFDIEVDSVRCFDVETQRTIEKLEKVEILPARELLLNKESREKLIEKLEKICGGIKGEDEREQKLEKVLKRDIERLRQGLLFPSLDKYIPYIFKEKPTIIDYLNEEFIVFWDEPTRMSEQMKSLENLHIQDVCDMLERGIIPEGNLEYNLPYKTSISRLEKMRFIGLSGISRGNHDYKPKKTYQINSKSLTGFQGRLAFLCDALKFYQQNVYRTIILAGSQIRAKKLTSQLEEEGIRCTYIENLTSLPNPGGIIVTTGSIRKSFEYPLIRTAVIGDKEIFGVNKKKSRRLKNKPGDKISSFTELNPGDYVVHQNHGVGLYTGIEQLLVEGIRKDYLKIQYRGTDVLYVPTDQMDMVFKHTAKEGARIKVNKLGGIEWGRTKQRVKEAAAEMAKQLIALYAQRSHMPGISFAPDTEWQRDFEASFPYEETEDQLQSIAEVKADMEKPCPMDRLLCGDVGYGKTEVAMRAAFKAVLSGYQVAYLVPTTILASQHYNNFKQR
ncbi:MAG: DEAD/DEAH box helicase, partial [Clostridia bacterium]|nr:DEAD/DEAH box helicase [Clostridia bacterium]